MRPFNEFSDTELATAFNKGYSGAFKEVYERYWLKMYKHALRMLKDENLAADTVQEVFTKLLEKQGKLWINGTISAYLFQATRNLVIQHYNRGKVKENYAEHFIAFYEDVSRNTEEAIIARDLERQFIHQIDLLPPKMKEVFNLSRNENLSHKQIAEKINISEGTVKKQIYNALKILRAKLSCLLVLFLP